jgi:hypothetical protein
MSVSYHFVADSDYFRTVIDRYYRQRPRLFWLPIQYGLIALPLLCAWLYALVTEASWTLIIAFILLLWPFATLCFVQLTKWGIMQRFRANADFGADVTTVLSESGIDARGRNAHTELAWTAYPTSVRFPDGILLLRAGAIRWLPDSAIQSGSPADATTLVGSKSKLRHVRAVLPSA